MTIFHLLLIIFVYIRPEARPNNFYKAGKNLRNKGFSPIFSIFGDVGAQTIGKNFLYLFPTQSPPLQAQGVEIPHPSPIMAVGVKYFKSKVIGLGREDKNKWWLIC